MTATLAGIERVRARIADAARDAGRAPQEITLVAVTKGFAWADVREIVEAAGLTDLGENRAQELRAKQAEARGDIRWHFIGALQRNKVKDVAGKVVLVHGVDSEPLAVAVGARAHDLGIVQDVLLQVNVSGEPTKHGVSEADAPNAARQIARIEGVRLKGLMTIAAPGDPHQARQGFARLRQLRDLLREDHPQVAELSMGMSEDLEQAIVEGATIVRVGTAIFGERPHTHGEPAHDEPAHEHGDHEHEHRH